MSKKPKKIDKPSLRPVYICGATAEDINKAFETGDIIKICEAIGVATRLANVSAIAKRTGIARTSVYRAFQVGRLPNFSTVLSVLDAMDLQLRVMARKND
jgi:probable addiction module antidote protein